MVISNGQSLHSTNKINDMLANPAAFFTEYWYVPLSICLSSLNFKLSRLGVTRDPLSRMTFPFLIHSESVALGWAVVILIVISYLWPATAGFNLDSETLGGPIVINYQSCTNITQLTIYINCYCPIATPHFITGVYSIVASVLY